MNASSVSRRLAAAGLRPVPRTREGIHVSGRSTPVHVTVGLDRPAERDRVAADVDAVLRAAYPGDVVEYEPGYFRVG